MFRSIYLFISFIFLFLIKSIISNDVILTQNLPSNVKAGEEFEVTVTINKGDISGFAKFQIEYPEGLEIIEKENYGATFTAKEGKVKFIWLSLPVDDVFSITYKVKTLSNAPEKFNLGGTFSYLEENNRMIVELKNKLVTVGGESTPIAQVHQEKSLPISVSAKRNIELKSDGSFDITIEVTQENVEGFVKIEELLPKESKTQPLETNKGAFSFINNKAKIVWVEAPSESTFKSTYNVVLTNPMDVNKIEGEFSYLDNNETKKIKVIGAKFEFPVVQNTSSEKTLLAENNVDKKELENETQTKSNEFVKGKKESKSTENTKSKKKEVKEKVSKEPLNSPNKNVTASNNIIDIPEPDNGILYRVQISAGHRTVGKEYFKKKHQFSEEFMIENHQGWIKYTIGKFSNYKGARNKREDLNGSYNLPGPFVTAYNSGERITVQEALMISNQKWYK